MIEHTNDYLLDKKVKIFQPVNGYRASSDAVLLSSLPHNLKPTDNILDVGSGTGGIALCPTCVSLPISAPNKTVLRKLNSLIAT